MLRAAEQRARKYKNDRKIKKKHNPLPPASTPSGSVPGCEVEHTCLLTHRIDPLHHSHQRRSQQTQMPRRQQVIFHVDFYQS